MISLISNYGELLTRLFPIPKNSHGYYEAIFFINGWKRVIVDDYIPIYIQNGIEKPNTCNSNKYSNSFYHILLEKAWAKVNKCYYNIYGGFSSNSLSVLTGFQGEEKIITILSDQNKIIEDMKKGIRKLFYLYGVNTNCHAYSLLDVETYLVNNQNYQVLKIRNPHGKTGTHFLKENDILLRQFTIETNGTRKLRTRAIVEDELAPNFEQFNTTEDNGIFFVSKKYFFKLFESYSKCYFMYNSSTIEFLLTFNLENINKRYFLFEMIVEENSMIQLNLTNHNFSSEGRMLFKKFNPTIKIKCSKGNYLVEWKTILQMKYYFGFAFKEKFK